MDKIKICLLYLFSCSNFTDTFNLVNIVQETIKKSNSKNKHLIDL